MSAYMQRQAELWQRRAWKAEDNFNCLMRDLENAQSKFLAQLIVGNDSTDALVDLDLNIKEIIEHYKGEMK